MSNVTTTEPSVESALAELREMFPVKVKRNQYGSNKTPRSIYVERHEYASSSTGTPSKEAKIHIQYASGGYSAPLVVSAPTLSEAMAQVRQYWQKQQESKP